MLPLVPYGAMYHTISNKDFRIPLLLEPNERIRLTFDESTTFETQKVVRFVPSENDKFDALLIQKSGIYSIECTFGPTNSDQANLSVQLMKNNDIIQQISQCKHTNDGQLYTGAYQAQSTIAELQAGDIVYFRTQNNSLSQKATGIQFGAPFGQLMCTLSVTLVSF